MLDCILYSTPAVVHHAPCVVKMLNHSWGFSFRILSDLNQYMLPTYSSIVLCKPVTPECFKEHSCVCEPFVSFLEGYHIMCSVSHFILITQFGV